MAASFPEHEQRAITRSGFSLVELLVTIGVIGVLIGIILPALFGARNRAEAVVTLSNLRQLSMTMDAYTERYRAYPWAPPGSWFQIEPPGEGGARVQPGYWDLDVYWAALMHDVAPWKEHFATWLGPGAIEDEEHPWRRGPGIGLVSYALCHPFFARPEVWEPGTVESDDLWRPVRPFEVSFPSLKVMMWDREA
ncbi:MAG TPA: prepilin-type N-terminal cleavage/methylation domain-containing protein, partial [Phycisphaerales bacterium]|nr:prepilin-type N-terminal cleavage/methylation domain-containing protein [Phycisphaerales bacterium]